MNLKPRVTKLLEGVLKEYTLMQKSKLNTVIQKLTLAAQGQPDPLAYQKELNDIVKTYKSDENSFYNLENEEIYNEFLNKLISFSQDKGIQI